MTGLRACLLGVSMLAVGIAIGLAVPGLGEEEPRDAGDREIARVVRAELSKHFDESTALVRGVVRQELAVWLNPAGDEASAANAPTAPPPVAAAPFLTDEQLDAEESADDLLRAARNGRPWTREDEAAFLKHVRSLPPALRKAHMKEASRALYNGDIQIDPAYFEGLMADTPN